MLVMKMYLLGTTSDTLPGFGDEIDLEQNGNSLVGFRAICPFRHTTFIHTKKGNYLQMAIE